METHVQKRFYPTIGQTFRLLVKFYLIALGYHTLFGTIGYFSGAYPDLHSSFVAPSTSLVAYVVTFLTIIYLSVNRFRTTNEIDYRLKFKKVPTGILFIGGIVVIAAGIITDPLIALIPMPKFFAKMFADAFRPDMLTFLSAVIAAPIAEEIFFRGIILEGFLKNYSPQKAIVCSALMFGIYHLNPWQAIGATVSGLVIGWIYWRTRSLVPGIFLHASNNLATFSILYLSGNSTDSSALLKNDRILYGLLVAVSMIIVVMGCNVLNKRFKNSVPHADQQITIQLG